MPDITIPAAAVEAGARELARIYELEYICDIDREWPQFVPQARAACLAMLEAWPGMRISMLFPPNEPHVVLPLPTEASDDK